MMTTMLVLLSCRQETSKICNECEEFSLPSFPDYTPMVSSSNMASDNPGQLTVNVSVSSFVENTDLTLDDVITEFQHAVDYWNQANFGLTLFVGSTEKECCVSERESGCTDCENDTASDVFFWTDDNFTGNAAGTRPVQSGFCPIAMDVFFYSNAIDDKGVRCDFSWVRSNVADESCTDGDAKEKPLHQSLVHEFGHLIGLADGSEEDSGIWKQSVMWVIPPGCTGCNHETVQFPDDQALIEMYQECN